MVKKLVFIGCILILAAQACIQVALARLDSQTTDEAVHLVAGYTYLTEGDYRFNPEHPPLVKTLAALPLLSLKLNKPDEADRYWDRAGNFFYDSWRENRTYAERWLYSSGNNPNQILFLGRLATVVVTLLLGVAIFAIAWRHWGHWAALVSVGIFALDPTVTAHGHLVTTDMAIALAYLLVAYTSWRFFVTGSIKWAIWLGLAFGLALLVKHTAIIALPLLVILFITVGIQKERASTRQLLSRFLISLLVAWAVIWIGFAFRGGVIPNVSSVTSETAEQYTELGYETPYEYPNQAVDQLYSTARPALSLLPAEYLKGLFLVVNHASAGHSSYLLGESSLTGWWYYFPVLFVLKTPLPSLLLGAIAIYLLLKRPNEGRLAVIFAVSASVYFGVAMFSKASLGIRHIMPVLPFFFLMIGWAAQVSYKVRWAAVVAAIWLVAVYSITYPTYLGYFNELSGKKENNHTIATDSNLDWGQDLYRIADYIENKRLVRPYVEYGWLGRAALDYYLGNNYRLLEDNQPATGEKVIIGASKYNELKDSTLKNCSIEMLTNGTFLCTVK
jgi:hypothetical protein